MISSPGGSRVLMRVRAPCDANGGGSRTVRRSPAERTLLFFSSDCWEKLFIVSVLES